MATNKSRIGQRCLSFKNICKNLKQTKTKIMDEGNLPFYSANIQHL